MYQPPVHYPIFSEKGYQARSGVHGRSICKPNFKAPEQQNTQTFYSITDYTVNSYITVVHML